MYKNIFKDIVEKYETIKITNKENGTSDNLVVSIRGAFGTGKTVNFIDRLSKCEKTETVLIDNHKDLKMLSQNPRYINSITKTSRRANMSNKINELSFLKWPSIISLTVIFLSFLIPFIEIEVNHIPRFWYFMLSFPITLILLKASTHCSSKIKDKTVMIENVDRMKYDEFINVISSFNSGVIKNSLIIVTFDTTNLRDRYLEKYSVETDSITNYIEKYFDDNYYLDGELQNDITQIDNKFLTDDKMTKDMISFIKRKGISNIRVIKRFVLPLLEKGQLEKIVEYLGLDVQQYIYIQYIKETKYELFKYLMDSHEIFDAKLDSGVIYEAEYVYRILNNQLKESDDINWQLFDKIKFIKDHWVEELPNILEFMDNRSQNNTVFMHRIDSFNKLSDSNAFNYYFKHSSIANDISFLDEASEKNGKDFIEYLINSKPSRFMVDRLNKVIELKGNYDVFTDKTIELAMREKSNWMWTTLMSGYFSNIEDRECKEIILRMFKTNRIDVGLAILSLLEKEMLLEKYKTLKEKIYKIADSIEKPSVFKGVVDVSGFSIAWRAMHNYLKQRSDAKQILYDNPEVFQFYEESTNFQGDKIPYAMYMEATTVWEILKTKEECLVWLRKTKVDMFLTGRYEPLPKDKWTRTLEKELSKSSNNE